jgi:hypothetical protein
MSKSESDSESERENESENESNLKPLIVCDPQGEY